MTKTPPHLMKTRSFDRGFTFLPTLRPYNGGQIQVAESSLATDQAIWLRVASPVDLNNPDGPTHECPAELTVDDALRLADQLCQTVADHYQFRQTRFDGPLGEMADRVQDAIAAALALLTAEETP